jgi:hypothetical protein
MTEARFLRTDSGGCSDTFLFYHDLHFSEHSDTRVDEEGPDLKMVRQKLTPCLDQLLFFKVKFCQLFVPLFLLLLDFLYFSPVPFFSAISPSSFSFYWIIFTRINTYFNIFYPKKEKARKNSLRTPSLSRDCLPIHIWAS